MAYTKAAKTHAIALYLDKGATAAAQAVGASRQSVYVWLAESDSDSKKGEASRAATAERLERKRAAMVELFHDKALELAAAVDVDDPATARFMLAACQAADKALLLAGLIRKTTDPTRLTLAEIEAQIGELTAQLGKAAPDAARHAEMDREMERVLAEVERKVRAELYAEIDQALAEVEHGDAPPRAAQRAQIIRDVASRKIEDPRQHQPPAKRHTASL
jgi:hypothetical protein